MSGILKSKNNWENLHINFGKRNIYAHLLKEVKLDAPLSSTAVSVRIIEHYKGKINF